MFKVGSFAKISYCNYSDLVHSLITENTAYSTKIGDPNFVRVVFLLQISAI